VVVAAGARSVFSRDVHSQPARIVSHLSMLNARFPGFVCIDTNSNYSVLQKPNPGYFPNDSFFINFGCNIP